MLVIRVGKKKIKLLNWIVFIGLIILMLYIIGSLIFLIPVFKKSYYNTVKKENYTLKEKRTFKSSFINCNVKEEIKIISDDKLINNNIKLDLKNEGFRKSGEVYIRKTKKHGFCKKYKKDYEKLHSKKYVKFNLNGKKNVKLLYKEDYDEKYVTAKIGGKESKNITINSNFNKNKIGTYIISYKLKLSDDYYERLYRKVSVIDNEKPSIKLIGNDKITINLKEKFIEPGFVATDNYDGNINKKVKIKNNINSQKPGIYKVTYTVKDSSGNVFKTNREITVLEKTKNVISKQPKIETKKGITYVNGIIIVNKKYGLPKDYDPGVNKEALSKLKLMQADAGAIGLNLELVSGYRSYSRQNTLYNDYVKKDGEALASTYSAKPGHSEHQTGLAFDIGSVDKSFESTPEAKWIEENAHLYGFIVRYPKNKTNITGYIYEPWHVRYLGVDIAKKVKNSNLSLEEYLGIN